MPFPISTCLVTELCTDVRLIAPNNILSHFWDLFTFNWNQVVCCAYFLFLFIPEISVFVMHGYFINLSTKFSDYFDQSNLYTHFITALLIITYIRFSHLSNMPRCSVFKRNNSPAHNAEELSPWEEDGLPVKPIEEEEMNKYLGINQISETPKESSEAQRHIQQNVWNFASYKNIRKEVNNQTKVETFQCKEKNSKKIIPKRLYDLGEKSQTKLRVKTLRKNYSSQPKVSSTPHPILLSGYMQDNRTKKESCTSIAAESESILKVLNRPGTSIKNAGKFFGQSLKNRTNLTSPQKRSEPANQKNYNLDIYHRQYNKQDVMFLYRTVSPISLKQNHSSRIRQPKPQNKVKTQKILNIHMPILTLTSQIHCQSLIYNCSRNVTPNQSPITQKKH